MIASFFLGMPGVWQIVIVVAVVVLLFGGKKIPELMRGIGGGIKEFKDASKDKPENEKSPENKNEEQERF